MSGPTTIQTTLLTSHKGVDLHAATAQLVMKDRLEGGGRLAGLFRCEMHTYWGEPEGWSVERLLDVGRFFNPNKHHFGHFEWAECDTDWLRGGASTTVLDARWPGRALGTDLTGTAADGDLYDLLLGGRPGAGVTAVDVASFPRGQAGPVLSGVLWRLLITGDRETALDTGSKLAVARHRKEGLLVNPHMEAWQVTAR